MYALGVDHIDNMLMLLGACSEMQPTDRDIILARMMKGFPFPLLRSTFSISHLWLSGFNDLALEAGTQVTGGQTVVNAWYPFALPLPTSK